MKVTKSNTYTRVELRQPVGNISDGGGTTWKQRDFRVWRQLSNTDHTSTQLMFVPHYKDKQFNATPTQPGLSNHYKDKQFGATPTHSYIIQSYISYKFGFKQHSSTHMRTVVLKETISYYVHQNSSVFCTFLDASKAFDRVNYCKLFRRLMERGLPPYIIRVLILLICIQLNRLVSRGLVLLWKCISYKSTQKKWKIKNKNTHEMNELGLIGTNELYHKINVFTAKTI